MAWAQDSFDCRALGDQASSQKPSAPGYSIGPKRFGKDLKGPKEGTKAYEILQSKSSPGPIYNVPSDLGTGLRYSFGCAKQRPTMKMNFNDASVDLIGAMPDSQYAKYENTKGSHFGTEARDSMKNSVLTKNCPQMNFGRESPGPASYLPDTAPVLERPESYMFGMKTKVPGSKCQTPVNVGPGKYKPLVAIGKQPISRYRTMSSWGFSKGSRFPKSTQDLSILTPDPPLSSMGKQVLSRVRSAPSSGFGTATRGQVAKTFFVQVPEDKGPVATWPHAQLDHPRLPMDKTVVKWGGNAGSGYQGMN